ncbi:MAG: chemotaxis protein CheB [Pirellulales bacterium]
MTNVNPHNEDARLPKPSDDVEVESAASGPDSSDSNMFPIVGIGASAGGLESLEQVFRHMPVNTGMAFVVIQHLSPDFKSLMDELLARYTDMTIHRAEHGMLVEPNSIYLIPPKKDMIIANRRLLLTDKDLKQPLSMPIDRFFRSLAQDAGRLSVGVILSGSGSDGSRGVRDIHAAGGLVICESEQTAKFDGMPLATLGTGDVDVVVPPEEVAQVLDRHARQLSLSLPQAALEPTPEIDDVQTVFKLLNDNYGIDFSHYKPTTVIRRIQRRMALSQAESLAQYAERLGSDLDELNVLYKDLLIGVTRFFRDVEGFEKLAADVLPDLVAKAEPDDEIRVWVAGCATGEEAYSLAILLHEQLEAVEKKPNVKIFATDVHQASLHIASEGIYPEESLTDVPPKRLARYFQKKPDGYHVVPELRQMMVFATHNIIKDAPFTKIDLITCRNLLIYFRPLAQKKALSLFHFGLKPNGVLFLGPSETPGELLDEFDAIDLHWKLYRKSRDVRLPIDLHTPLSTDGSLGRTLRSLASAPARSLPDSALVSAYDAMLARYMPPGLLINERRELLHVFGGAERYLKVKPGRPSIDALEALDNDLRTAVTGAVQRVVKERAPVRYSGVRVRTAQGEETLDISVEPVDNPRSRLAQLLVLIRPSSRRQPAAEPEAASSVAADQRQMSRDRIESLEDELRFNKENLQATIEELETSNEEMQATNEELVASNEELQSTNEELQSVNEELFTVNAEYQRKITELSELTADMDNLLVSTEIGTIFLDQDLSIRKYTPQIGVAFHLLPQDIGRSITSFAHNIHHPALLDDLRAVVADHQPRSREVRDQHGNWFYLRVLPYRAKSRFDGVVLTLIDVTPLKAAEQKLADAVRRRDEFLAMLSHELRNPLGAIRNAAQGLFMSESVEPVERDLCDIIRRQSDHLARLLDDLLDVARVTQRKIELRQGPVDVALLVRDTLESVQPLFEAAGVTLSVPDVPAQRLFVRGDSARLQQALSNVLANAVKYTPRGGNVALIVQGQRNQVSIQVRDTGIGMLPETIESMFELFVQETRTFHGRSGGMGIGLTLARSILELHGGTIEANSDGPGQGSMFEIRLPRIFRETPAPGGDPAATSSQPREFPCNVVIVEDSDDNRLVLKRLLELLGCTVHAAENGTKGLALIEQHKPDLALIDLKMPGLDGCEVARQVRQSLGNSDTFLAAVTGMGQAADLLATAEAGFDAHLLKPLDLAKLRQILEQRSRGRAAAPL